MRPSFRPQLTLFIRSPRGLLQVAAFGVVAWALLHEREPQPSQEPQAFTSQQDTSGAASGVASSADANTALAPQTASLGLSTIEVIVSQNDTLDRIFRRLELNLTDLATLRALPGIAAKLDRLYPGEALKIF